MTKQVQQAIIPTHILGSTGTVDGSNLGYRALASFAGDLAGTGYPSGTASLPAYSFAGDLDTGMWRPEANVLAFSTDGTQKMTVLANGRVGVGTSDPLAPLHVVGDVYSTGVFHQAKAAAVQVAANDTLTIPLTLVAPRSIYELIAQAIVGLDNSQNPGVYLISRQGTDTKVIAVSAAENITVAITNNQIVLTNPVSATRFFTYSVSRKA